MFALNRLIVSSLFVFVIATTALAQETLAPINAPREPVPAAPTVTASATAKRVRFVSPGSVVQLRLEVYNEAGQKLIDTELRGGNVLDWHLQDAAGERLPAGSYACVLTIKSLSGRLSQRVGVATINDKTAALKAAGADQLSVAQQQTIGPVEDNSSLSILQENEAITAVTHDGTDGQLTSTTGALTFRTGDLFAARDVERMRITPEGSVGIGTDKPEATLDVAGSIRARGAIHAEKIEFADGTVQTSGTSGRKLEDGTFAPNATGTGTQNFISKWIDNAGTLGDSVLFESSGRIGLGTTTPGAKLHVVGTQGSLGGGTFQLDTSTLFSSFTNAYPAFEVINTNATNNNVSFFQFADAASGAAHAGIGAVNINHTNDWGDLFFFSKAQADGYQVRMGIYSGNVGIGTTVPTAKLDVTGNIKASGSLTGASATVTGNLTVDTNTLHVDALNNRVGIGTTTPGVPLDVAGDINTSTQYKLGGLHALSNSGTDNLFAGASAGAVNTGTANSFFGASAGAANIDGDDNSFFGRFAGKVNVNSNDNSFFGSNAGAANVNGFDGSFFGSNAGATNTASGNSFFGSSAGAANTSGSANSFFGKNAGAANVTTTGNSFFGSAAGAANTAHGNSFFGRNAGTANTSGANNAFFGDNAGSANTTAGNNSYFGDSSGSSSTGANNSFFGSSTGSNNTGVSNSFLGWRAGWINTSGSGNSFFGESAGSANTTGGSNSFFGHDAGLSNTTETNNTFLGYASNGVAGITNATAVGANAVVTQSDSFVLGNGVKVGAGTSAPKEKVHVLGGNIYIDGIVASNNGLILKSPNGTTCAKLTIDNAGALVTTVIACP